MTEMVMISEHGRRFHRDQKNGDRRTVCGAYGETRPRRVSRLKAQAMGYAPCGRVIAVSKRSGCTR